jgi:sugar/nucleoside kinase (ribokinase family)
MMAGGVARPLDLLVLGDVNPDVVVTDADPRFGQHERLVRSIELTIGGSAGIMAAGAARLGLRVGLVGVMGDDTLGRFMLAELRARGVDVAACRIDRTRPTGASVVLTRGTDRAILTATGTIADLTEGDVPAGLIESARHVHVASYFLQAGLWAGLPDLLRRARAAGTGVSVDPNWDPHGSWDAGLVDLLPLIDVFLPNEPEARLMTGGGDATALGPDPTAAAEAARRLRALGQDRVVVAVKRGGDGVLAIDRDGSLIEVPAYPVEVVDTVGAGDAFDAGFLAAWLDGRPVGECLASGVVCGALSTRAAGGTASQATRDELEAALARWQRG